MYSRVLEHNAHHHRFLVLRKANSVFFFYLSFSPTVFKFQSNTCYNLLYSK